MRETLDTNSTWAKIVSGAALGAAAMYVFDPEKGRRRRAIARDKARSFFSRSGDIVGDATRDANNRWQGARASVRRLFARDVVPDDDVLVERVRARLGRVVLHPHAVHVTAHDGRVELEGPILASEEPILLAATWSVPGVSDIENRLERHDRPDHVPALQGTGRQRMRSWLMQEHWTPALRVAAVVSGTAMALQALRQRGPAGVLLTFLGAALVTRGATNVPLRRAIGVGRGRRAFDVHKVIHVAAAPQTVFDMWKDHENFPRFMSHVCEVRDLGNGRSHWTVKGPAGTRLDWGAVVTQLIPGKLIAWKTEQGSLVQHAGSVYFEESNGGTRLTVRMSYNVAGGLGNLIAMLLGSDPRKKVDDDLMRMKMFIETGVPPHDAASRGGAVLSSQPYGEHSSFEP